MKIHDKIQMTISFFREISYFDPSTYKNLLLHTHTTFFQSQNQPEFQERFQGKAVERKFPATKIWISNFSE